MFKLNTDGSSFTVLKQFASGDPVAPTGGLVLSGTTLYETTLFSYGVGGGGSGVGTVFRINTDGSGYTVLRDFSGGDGCGPRAALLLDGQLSMERPRAVAASSRIIIVAPCSKGTLMALGSPNS